MTPPNSQSPLNGIKVVEICQVAAGPFCGMLLADYGADVLKIEPLAGDSMRQWPPVDKGYSENFASVNRGKRSAALDLKNPADLELARALILEADVLIENNRPGAMQRLGLGWDWFRERKPSLVYCSISAFGQTGPRAKEGGFDLTIQAASGVMSVTGEPGGEPVKCGVPVSDFTAGLYAAFTISSMIANVRAGGEGGHIDVPMFATTLAIAALQTSEYFGTGTNPAKLGSAHPRNAPYEAFHAQDGWFVLAAGNDKLWQSVCSVTETLHLLGDERFETQKLRATNQKALKDLLQYRFETQDVAHWLVELQAVGVPCAPINGYSDALNDPQSDHLQLVRPISLPGGQTTQTVACPIWVNDKPIEMDATLPTLGEVTERLRATTKFNPDDDD